MNAQDRKKIIDGWYLQPKHHNCAVADELEKELAERQADLETVAADYQSLGVDLARVADERDRAVAELVAARELLRRFQGLVERTIAGPPPVEYMLATDFLSTPSADKGQAVLEGLAHRALRPDQAAIAAAYRELYTPSSADKVQAVLDAADEQERIGSQSDDGPESDSDYFTACCNTNEAVRALHGKDKR